MWTSKKKRACINHKIEHRATDSRSKRVIAEKPRRGSEDYLLFSIYVKNLVDYGGIRVFPGGQYAPRANFCPVARTRALQTSKLRRERRGIPRGLFFLPSGIGFRSALRALLCARKRQLRAYGAALATTSRHSHRRRRQRRPDT